VVVTDSGAPMADGRQALVIGAGIVGTCSALYLQREGFDVTLIDRDGPGEGCSSGNAGGLGIASFIPLAMPGSLGKVPAMLFDPDSALKIHWSHLPRALPWFIRFAQAGRPKRVEEIADALSAALADLFECYESLLAETDASDLVRREGKLYVYESEASFAGGQYSLDLRRRRGIEVRALSGDEAREIEPALGPAVKRGAYIPAAGQTINPLRLTQTLAQLFQKKGGTILRETVKGFELSTDGPPKVVTDAATHNPDLIVVAAGAWSKKLAAQLGTRVCMESQRGYHAMLPDAGVATRVSVQSSERHIIISQMEHGLRITGIADFEGLEAPPNYARADTIVRHAQALVPGLKSDGMTRWMGNRPSTPDSMPVIGPAPGHPSVLFAFGHCMIGLGLGAVTGRTIGELAAGRKPSIDITPFRPERF
jgi:D-amino-acid dehydrogenase